MIPKVLLGEVVRCTYCGAPIAISEDAVTTVKAQSGGIDYIVCPKCGRRYEYSDFECLKLLLNLPGNKIHRQVDRTVEEHVKEQSEKPKVKVDEPTYRELICWCKLNIKELLQIAYADSDKHINEQYGGEIGLLNAVDGYIQTIKEICKLEETEKEIREDERKQVYKEILANMPHPHSHTESEG